MDPIPAPQDKDGLHVPFSRVGAFARQLSHDVRNGLNALDLEAAYIAELVTDPEVAGEVKKLRVMITAVARQIQGVVGSFAFPPVRKVEFPVAMLIEEFHNRLGKAFPDLFGEVDWYADVGEQLIEVDLESLYTALFELFRNAFQFREAGGAIEFRASVPGGKLLLEISETKPAAPDQMGDWGTEPLRTTRRGGFGLGLYSAAQRLEAHGGEIIRSYDEAGKRLITRVAIPLKS